MKATYYGEETDQGTLIPHPVNLGEGFAILQCGNTQVVLSYTALHQIAGLIAVGRRGGLGVVSDTALQRAFSAIAAEASIGRKPPSFTPSTNSVNQRKL